MRKKQQKQLLKSVENMEKLIKNWQFYDSDYRDIRRLETQMETRIKEDPDGIDPYFLYGEGLI